MSDPFRTAVAAICRRLPGAEVSDPWGGGHDAWKVGGKMFACIGTVAQGTAPSHAASASVCVAVSIRQVWITLPRRASAPR